MTGRAPACNCSLAASATDDTTGYTILAIVAMSHRRPCPAPRRSTRCSRPGSPAWSHPPERVMEPHLPHAASVGASLPSPVSIILSSLRNIRRG